ncbi:hypothetical protein H1D32_02360 [Anaerobacillus sp. CMMVII]|uniref:hypothetical protein n=1 Tax=Anaerobacillus sp. CMMVII TaxID=2755588 RepID=UPI0021B7368D|nr:hypothetical protein [Anaerobacillus sp. CMMVII]MCT8136692.1 hypothetical protein [Anaerobacillus sp. CMMVII]
MFDQISIINALYQVVIFAALFGIIYFAISLVRGLSDNKKRLKRLEEQTEYLMNKIEEK